MTARCRACSNERRAGGSWRLSSSVLARYVARGGAGCSRFDPRRAIGRAAPRGPTGREDVSPVGRDGGRRQHGNGGVA
jgi:hypothetical protein